MSGSISTFKKALALVPKGVGALSFFGSLFVAQDIIRNEKKRQSIFHRIMLGLSIFDTITSFVNILSTWPTPEGTVGIFLAVGTTATCTAQGFFNEFGNITTPLYSASLCVWYLLFLKYGRKEKDCRKYELAFHVVPISVGLAMAVIGVPLNLYNNSGFLCWYAPFPNGCDQSIPTTCTRGAHAGIFRWIHYGIIWTAITFITYAMLSIYVAVRCQEGQAISRMSILSNTSRKKSKAVAGQALLYVCALYLTWFFTTCTRISQTAFKHHSDVLLMLMAIFFPLQGFWNAFIYIRPQWLHNRRAKKVKRNNGQSSTRISVVSFTSDLFSNNNTKDSTGIGTSYNSDDLEHNAKEMLEVDAREAVKFHVNSSNDDEKHEKIIEGVISAQAPLDASTDSSSNNNNNNNDSSSTTGITQSIVLTEKGLAE